MDLGSKKLHDNRAHLQETLAAEQRQLQRLMQAKESCEDDLRHKVISRDIDKQCKARAHRPWSPETSVPPTTAEAASTSLDTSTDFGFSSTYSDGFNRTGGFSTS